ncbi:MAG: E3 binding domain-containing protein [Gemmatimonadetes bacterium]|nr:E3 binding domain-containing protein [Gemmatimonadota bacterium]
MQAAPSAPPAAPAPAAAPANDASLRSSPLARRLAADHGIALGALHGSGPGGRIIKRDVEAAASSTTPPSAAPSAATPVSRVPSPLSGSSTADVPSPRFARRSPVGSRSRSARSPRSTSPPNWTWSASPRCAPRWPSWVMRTRFRSTTSSSRPSPPRWRSTPSATLTGRATRFATGTACTSGWPSP